MTSWFSLGILVDEGAKKVGVKVYSLQDDADFSRSPPTYPPKVPTKLNVKTIQSSAFINHETKDQIYFSSTTTNFPEQLNERKPQRFEGRNHEKGMYWILWNVLLENNGLNNAW